MSLASRLSPADLRIEPFPHVVIRPALDDALADALVAEFPPMECVTGRTRWASNERYSYSGPKVLADPRVSARWKRMVREHTSQAFLDDILRLLAPAIRARHPDFESRFGLLEDLKAGTRGIDCFGAVDVLLDAQICINTPVTGMPTSVRGGHVDESDKLFSGLYYLRHPDDDARGGNLQLFRVRRGSPRCFHGKYIADRWIEAERTVEYDRNVFVVFLNGPWAVHAVTPRSKTRFPRLFFNVLGEVSAPVFDLSSRQVSFAGLHTARRVAAARLRRWRSPRLTKERHLWP